MEEINPRCDNNFDTLTEELKKLEATLNDISALQKLDHSMTLDHDKILVRGNGSPSLQEVVRNLKKTLDEFIVDVKTERERRNKRDEEELLRIRQEQSRWKWVIIGLLFTLIPGALWEIITFWVEHQDTLKTP